MNKMHDRARSKAAGNYRFERSSSPVIRVFPGKELHNPAWKAPRPFGLARTSCYMQNRHPQGHHDGRCHQHTLGAVASSTHLTSSWSKHWSKHPSCRDCQGSKHAIEDAAHHSEAPKQQPSAGSSLTRRKARRPRLWSLCSHHLCSTRREVRGLKAKPGLTQDRLPQSESHLHSSSRCEVAPSTHRLEGLRACSSTLAISQVCSPIIRHCKIRWSIRSLPERLLPNASRQLAGGAHERATMGRVALGF